ncbi:unnamed protein product, partial [Rotaria sordida]
LYIFDRWESDRDSITLDKLIDQDYSVNEGLKNYLYRHRQSKLNPNGPTLSESAMIQLVLDVADGMYYLLNQKFAHRDLAARIYLVNGNHTCKVGKQKESIEIMLDFLLEDSINPTYSEGNT